MNSSALPRLALIAGPTASGKSALALELAQRANGTIINADASQVYRDLRVLTARPAAEEEARVPHALFGHIDSADSYSAARWAADAKAAIGAAHAAGRLPILVGGTGLYLRTLTEGIAPVPPIENGLRANIRQLPVTVAYAALQAEDPAAAARLAPADTQRIARALEVVRSTGRPLAWWQSRREGGIAAEVQLTAARLLPDRAWLTARIDARAAQMLLGGAREEVATLLARDLTPDAPVLRAIGVPEVAALLGGEIDQAEALARLQQATRGYAKRQYTWFRNQPSGEWSIYNGLGDVVDTMLEQLSRGERPR